MAKIAPQDGTHLICRGPKEPSCPSPFINPLLRRSSNDGYSDANDFIRRCCKDAFSDCVIDTDTIDQAIDAMGDPFRTTIRFDTAYGQPADLIIFSDFTAVILEFISPNQARLHLHAMSVAKHASRADETKEHIVFYEKKDSQGVMSRVVSVHGDYENSLALTREAATSSHPLAGHVATILDQFEVEARWMARNMPIPNPLSPASSSASTR